MALWSSFFNVSILIGGLVYFLRKLLAEFVSGRHTSMRDELQKVASQLKDAREKYDEFSAKLKAMQAEIAVLRDQARMDGEAIKLRIINDGRRAAANIIADAQGTSEAILEDLRVGIRKELAATVLDRAEIFLKQKITQTDKNKFRKDFPRQIESAQ